MKVSILIRETQSMEKLTISGNWHVFKDGKDPIYPLKIRNMVDCPKSSRPSRRIFFSVRNKVEVGSNLDTDPGRTKYACQNPLKQSPLLSPSRGPLPFPLGTQPDFAFKFEAFNMQRAVTHIHKRTNIAHLWDTAARVQLQALGGEWGRVSLKYTYHLEYLGKKLIQALSSIGQLHREAETGAMQPLLFFCDLCFYLRLC